MGTRGDVAALAALEQQTTHPFRSRTLSRILLVAGTAIAAAGAVTAWIHRADVFDVRLLFACWVVVILFWSVVVLGIAAPMGMPSATERLAADGRAPVLFLRSFTEDAHRTYDQPREDVIRVLPGLMQRINDAQVALLGPRAAAFLDRIDRRFNFDAMSVEKRAVASSVRQRPEQWLQPAMSHLGPFVAVGRPGERLPTVGALRLYVPHTHWKHVVWGLTGASRLVIVQVGSTPGAMWELFQAVRRLDPRRLMLLVPDARTRPLGYERARELTRGLLPFDLPEKAEGSVVLFDSHWSPRVLDIADADVLVARVGEQLARLPEPPSLGEAWAEEPPVEIHEVPAQPSVMQGAVDRAAAVPQLRDTSARVPAIDITHQRFPARLERVLARAAWRKGLWRWVVAGVATLMISLLISGAGTPAYIGSFWLSLFVAAALLGFVERKWAAYLLALGAGAVVVSELADFWPLYATAAIVAVALVHRAWTMLRVSGATAAEQVRRAVPAAGADDATAIASDLFTASSPLASLWLGHEWLLIDQDGLTPVRLGDVLWLYAKRIRRRLLFVPIASAWYVAVHTRARTSVDLRVRKRDADRAVDILRAAAPQAIAGMSAAMLDAWNHDFEELVRAVDGASSPTRREAPTDRLSIPRTS